MKFATSPLLLGATLAPLAHAFPAAMMEEAQRNPELAKRGAELLKSRQTGADAATALFEPIPEFNAAAQLIDVSGDYAWVAPGPDDIRGPCPGLNAFANHGYLPHDGYATVEQFIDITMKVVGMGPLLSAFLSVLGGLIDGDLVAWSIGGTPPANIGFGNGLTGSHNKYESDASPTRPDLYQSGNNYKTVASQFQQMIDANPGSITIDQLTAYRSQRFQTQAASNPYFFNGPFSGVLVQPAAYTFIFRFMANHSEEYPTGYLSHDVVASWFAIEGESGDYTANQGYERIPENWYRRPDAYPYDIPYFLADVVNAAALHPEFLDIGGNLGETNTFTGVNVTGLTNGVFNGADLLEGNNLGCFAFQAAAQIKADLIEGAILTTLLDTLGSVITQLSCPQLEAIDDSQLQMFPGYQMANVSFSESQAKNTTNSTSS